MWLLRLKKWDAFRVYLIQSGLSSLFFTMIFTVNMIYQVEKIGLSPLQLVLVGTTLEISVLLFEIPTGVVADVYSRRLSVIIGFFIIGIGFIIEGAIPSFAAIIVAQVVWGLGYTFTSGATDAWIADELGEANLARVYLRSSQLGRAGSLVGVLLAVLIGSAQINLPIILAGMGIMGIGLLLVLVMPETGFKRTPAVERGSWHAMLDTFRAGLRLVRGRRMLLAVLGIGLFLGLYSEGYDRLWTAHLLENFTFPAFGGFQPVVWFGAVQVAGSLLSIAVSEWAMRRVRDGKPAVLARMVLALNGLLVVALFAFAWAGDFALAFALVLLVDVLRSTISPIYSAWINQHIESNVRATVLSMAGQVDAFGQIAGGPVAGLIGDTVSIRAALTTSALILSPVLLLIARLLRQPETTPAVEST